MPDIRLRCSALPLAFLCPASVRDGGTRIDEVHPAAGVGSAVHEALRALVEARAVDWDGLHDLAARHNADPEETALLCRLGARLWRAAEGAETFANPVTELPLSMEVTPGVILTGTLDICGTGEGPIALVADWKTGRVDYSPREQMLGYCALALADQHKATAAVATVLWVRDGDVERYSMRREDLPEWRERFVSEVVEWDGTYRPGEHCRHCPRSHDCAAAGALARRDVAAMVAEDQPPDLAMLRPDQTIALYDRAKAVADMAARVLAAIKAHVADNHGGELAANGTALVLEEQARRVLDPMKAWPVLEDAGLEDEDFAEVVTLSVTRLEKRVAKRAGKGNGARAVRELTDQLEAAGALTRNPTTKLQRRRR